MSTSAGILTNPATNHEEEIWEGCVWSQKKEIECDMLQFISYITHHPTWHDHLPLKRLLHLEDLKKCNLKQI